MAITPTGDPAWIRTSDHATYGGDLNKTNYQSQGVVNARTDVGAEQFVRLVEDLAACARVAPLAVLTYTQDDTGLNDPTVNSINMMTAVQTAIDYDGGNPPTGFPSVVRVSDGVVDITFPTTLDDAYGVTGTVSIVHAFGTLHGTDDGDANPDITAANVVRVRTQDGGGALLDKTVTVEIGT